jgi:protease-4
LLLWGCEGNEPPKPGKELRSIHLPSPLAESPEHGGPLPSDHLTHHALLERLSEMASAKGVSGIFLQIGEMGGAWGRVADLRDALSTVRKAGKPVHCHFETTDNLGYSLLAQSCDRISITPAGMLDLVGVSAEAVYARELLQTLGLRADAVQIGRFKGAADPFTRDDMPPEVQQTMNALLDDLQAAVISAVAHGRSLPAARVQALIDQGPFTAEQARSAGLVDDVSFDDAARAQAKAAAKADRVVIEQLQPEHESIGLWKLLRTLTGGSERHKTSGKRLVLAYLDGTIMRGSAGSFRSAHAESFVRGMHELADDAGVRAVVLRIDSPGGSAMASDLMWHAVRRLAKRKPVIVSIGDLCASGGYYVASAGTEIVAQDQSLVGSIGVVGGKIVAEDLARRLGVHIERLTRGKHAGWTSAARGWSPEERTAFDHALRDGYELFLRRIAEGRGMKIDEIEPLAEGRLMSARRAREGKLVDHEGGLSTAIALARKRGSLADDAPIQIWPERPNLLQALSEITGGAEARSAVLDGLSVPQRTGIIELLLSGDDMPAAVLPYVLSLH